jgi:hypothetical protein
MKSSKCFLSALALFYLVIANTADAIGLDDIQPTEMNEAEDSNSPPASVKPSAPSMPTESPAKSDDPAASQEAIKSQVAAEPAAKKQPDKLHLSASYGYVRIPKAELGEMSARGLADLSLLWNFINNPSRNVKAMLTFRYAPIHSENLIDGQSYKSIIEGYHLGGQYRYRFLHKDLELVASAELGYLLVYQESRDKYPVQEDLEKNELAYTVGTGFEWVLMDKISVGPRFYAGFGSIQIIQATGSVTFAF